MNTRNIPTNAPARAPRHAPGRRRFITLAGGGAVLAAAPLAGCSSAYPDAATAAWGPPPPTPDVRRFMLAHALLAPNPHNRQPWLADLSRDGEITLVCDPDRLLPETDPFGRQIVIGCGAFIELAAIAAAERGHRVELRPFPAGEPAARALPGGVPIATLALRPDAQQPRDPLFAQIRRRHTNREAYDGARAVPAADWQRLLAPARELGLPAGAIVEPAPRERVRTLTRAAWEAEMVTARTWLESARLMRIGPAEIERHRDGIPINGALPRAASALGLFDRFEVPAPGSANHRRVMERWAPSETGSGYLWIASRGNGRRAQLDAGRAYVRAHLAATAAGIDLQPLSQALQEFPEVRPQYDALHALLGFDPATTTLQMLARVGYGARPAAPAPRRELAQLLRG